VLGTDDLYAYADKYGVELDPKLVQLCGYRPKLPWRRFVTDDNKHLVSPEALALLTELLRYDHQARPTAAEAMQHEFFAPIRAMQQQAHAQGQHAGQQRQQQHAAMATR
jgi:casein kinase II subunit alpha